MAIMQCKPPRCFIPGDSNHGKIPLLVVVIIPLIVIQGEAAVLSRIGTQVKRRIGLFIGIGDFRTKWHNRSTANIERYGVQCCIGTNRLACPAHITQNQQVSNKIRKRPSAFGMPFLLALEPPIDLFNNPIFI